MPNPKVNAKKINYNVDNDLLNLIEEAEKIIESNRNTSRIRNQVNNGVSDNLRVLRNIRNELDALDTLLEPTPLPLPQNDNNILPQLAESSTSVVSMSISNNCSSSTTVTTLHSSTSGNEDDDVLLVTDGLSYPCNYIAPTTDIVDLCSPIYVNRHRRRRRPINNDDDQIDIIELDDYQPLHKTKATLESPPKEKKSLESPKNNSDNSYNTNIIMCPICLESTANRKPKSTKCGHVFCSDCIINSLRITKKCPICKRTCSEKHLITLFL